MASVKDHFGGATPTPATVAQNLPEPAGIKIESTEIIGIEVEVENANHAVGKHKSFWDAKGDSSLRNSGVEFVTKPIRACDAPRALQNLFGEALKDECCFSPRTSVHIHLNYIADSIDTVTDTILLYAVFEKLFFKFVGRQRIKNIYCVPITETNLLASLGRKGLRTDYWQKYAGLNAKPLAQYGTLEFRHMHGTRDIAKLCVWIDLITQLKAYCVAKGTKNIRTMLVSMDDSFNFEQLIADIFMHNKHHMKYNSIEDVKSTYRSAKLGLATQRETERLAQAVTADSLFYKLRAL